MLGATLNVAFERQPTPRPAAAAPAVEPRREPPQPWRSLMVLLAMIFGALLAGRRRKPAA